MLDIRDIIEDEPEEILVSYFEIKEAKEKGIAIGKKMAEKECEEKLKSYITEIKKLKSTMYKYRKNARYMKNVVEATKLKNKNMVLELKLFKEDIIDENVVLHKK